MKAILLSIRPKGVQKILDGEKTIEIRKQFPKDYVGWVYIYCTKDRKFAHFLDGVQINSEVVARFWCDKVEEIIGCLDPLSGDYFVSNKKELISKSCLTEYELENYLDLFHMGVYTKVVGYAIPITKLEIFVRPKEISEFYKNGSTDYINNCPKRLKGKCNGAGYGLRTINCIKKEEDCKITKAPKTYRYVEVEE